MNADIVKQMRAEEADLVRKLQAVRDFLAAYGEAPNDSGGSAQTPRSQSASSQPREKVDITSFTEQTRRSVVLSMMAMEASPGLVRTRELVQFIENMGHKVTGKNPVNALGALLARSEDVEGHGKSGWALADRARARQIIEEYGPKAPTSDFEELLGSNAQNETEPTSGQAGGSDAGMEGAPTPTNPFEQPSDQSAYS